MNFFSYFFSVIIAFGILGLLLLLFIKDEDLKLSAIIYIIGSLLYGTVGLVINVILSNFLSEVLVPIAFIISLFIAAFASKIIVPKIINTYRGKHLEEEVIYDLIGSVGIAETKIDKSFGVVSLDSNIKKMICKSYNEIIEKGERILITDYSENDDLYIVDKYPK